MMRLNKGKLTIALFIAVLITACGSSQTKNPQTLADVDIVEKKKLIEKNKDKKKKQKKTAVEQKSAEQVREAYRKYIDKASGEDVSRHRALTRLAELELELSNSLLKDSSKDEDVTTDYTGSLNRTIKLLEDSLVNYPSARDNDKVLYQLAQAYDQTGRYEDSISTLLRLTGEYPTSLFYPEAQFRLGETYFVRGNYISAEDAYTEVVLTPGGEKFYEKALFKRGWTRYKQQFYDEALDDYFSAFKHHRFAPESQLSDTEKSQYNEYFRAIALSFTYMPSGSIQSTLAQQTSFDRHYKVYEVMSDIFIQQERFSDAAKILEEYTKSYQANAETPKAELKIIAAWQSGGFTGRLASAIENFYIRYNPGSNYWKKVSNDNTRKLVDENLRKYIVQLSSFSHENYQKKRKQSDYNKAKLWYDRYLSHYKSYAQQDHIFTRYAELLISADQLEPSLQYFALAAYDGEIILDKKSAYSTISISSELVKRSKRSNDRNKWLNQHLTYALRFVELYPKDTRTENIALSASQLAFNAKQYDRAISIANYIPDSASEKSRFEANNVKARSFLELNEYSDAESVYSELLNSRYTNKKTSKQINNSLALAIYRQAEAAKKDANLDIALNHFVRIGEIVPDSDLAPTGLYDAIALSMNNKQWDRSVALIERFKDRYPRHEKISDVSKNLSVAYLNSNQKDKAAKEFEKLANLEQDQEVKRAALWQAAELYEDKKDYQGAVRTYRTFAHTYDRPYEQNMEAMFKLSDLYKKNWRSAKTLFLANEN